MKISLSQLNTTSLRNYKLMKNPAGIFWCVLLFVLLAQIYLTQKTVREIFASGNIIAKQQQNKAVRINFSAYERALIRIEKAKNFKPENFEGPGPILPLPDKSKPAENPPARR